MVSTDSVSGKDRAIHLRATGHQPTDNNIIGELKKVDSSFVVWVVQQERLMWLQEAVHHAMDEHISVPFIGFTDHMNHVPLYQSAAVCRMSVRTRHQWHHRIGHTAIPV